MPRPKKRRVNKDRSIIPNMDTKTRNLVKCKCVSHCNVLIGQGTSEVTGSMLDHHQLQKSEPALYKEDNEVPDNDDVEDDHRLSEDDVPVKQFTTPDFDDLDFESDLEYPDMNIEFNDSWILLWILKYQSRFCLSDVAIDSLVKFFRIVLLDADHTRFKEFLTSSYMMRKILGNRQAGKSSNSGFKCTHVEFPNHLRHSQRQPCGTELIKKVPVVKGHIGRPKMIFPLSSLKMQIISMY
ncbi:16928_t:CDS:2 [Funneliformis caledonium]|uniref:16928_t:CDS:1 n=1 Tax=Funneliformis caledonium TaxID=1117310 RepID=A0A9N9HFI9_9GLOM|nr:16928_t:CDS:2 [Funneliformis caledonium]